MPLFKNLQKPMTPHSMKELQILIWEQKNWNTTRFVIKTLPGNTYQVDRLTDTTDAKNNENVTGNVNEEGKLDAFEK